MVKKHILDRNFRMGTTKPYLGCSVQQRILDVFYFMNIFYCTQIFYVPEQHLCIIVISCKKTNLRQKFKLVLKALYFMSE